MEEDEWDDALLSEIASLETRHLQTHSNQQPSADPSSAVVASSTAWSCQSCTLQNESTRSCCLVCAAPRYQKQHTSPRRTVQARLAFGGTSMPAAVPPLQQKQDVGRSEPSPFAAREQSVTGSGLVLTSRRPGKAAEPATLAAKRSASTSPLQIPRHAAGEDSQAKKRYLDVMARSNFPQIDYEAAQSFVYPTNYSVREYQLTIAEKALYHNTLVSLPTGLGKTLVAAVVMYNFYRWFPTGKIVFMAPTKPLVAQQIKACHEIMGIPLSDTAELQGNVPPTTRRVLWNSRRVFFCTPQSLQNDLRRGVCAADKFVCIVVDEAHRATGNYAYCCVVQEIEAKTSLFRILALSATPGAKFEVIQEVVTNLRISHIESRSADDPDVKKYTHARQEEVIVCRLGAQILAVKAQLIKCLTPISERLLRGNIIQQSDPDKLSGWYVLQAREKFRKSPSYAANRSAESDLALLVSLLHAKSLLTGHGLCSFREQITNWTQERETGRLSWSKREMLQSSAFRELELSLAVMPDAKTSANPASHPKLVKLREVLLEHFQRHAAGRSSTRAIVFTQYRASVSEIVALLRPLAPLLNAQPFIGQGASGKAKENKGQTQKEQQEIVRRFRLGEFNVLVATCIAEEGLDIGEVDLIVSFDALTSPVRMIQRMGRTGRKRVGRVIILVTEGDEQKKLARSASAAKTVSRALTTFKSRFVYSKCPRMLPTGMCPRLKELEMKIPTFRASQVGGKTATTTLDPALWQLSDAERAVALLKYFPPHFASSSRHKVVPVVANRQHLLRRQPRSLARKGAGTRVGYSARSLTLQGIVRKIHGVEEVLETDSDEDGREGRGSTTGNGGSPPEEGKSNSSPRLGPDESRRRPSATTTNAATDSESGSPWRPRANLSGDDEGKCGDSFLATESVATFDMHFSPQFVDSATQVAPEAEEVSQPQASNKRREEDPAAPAAKKQRTGPDRPGPSASEAAGGSQRVDGVLGGQCTSSDNEDKAQQMSATLASTLTSESPSSSENIGQQAPVEAEVNDTTESTQVPLGARLRSTRQLQFDEEDGDDPLDEPRSAPPPQKSSEAKQADASLEKLETTVERGKTPSEAQAADEEPPALLFASLPPITGETNADGSEDDAQAEEEPCAYSFALLPSLEASSKAIPSKPSRSLEVTDADGGSQPVEDGTDGDGADEANEEKAAIKNDLVDSSGTSAVVVDLTRKDSSSDVENHEEKLKEAKPRAAGATQRAAQSQPEQEGEGCCSVCLESESYDDDPIVFCDGCNVAVHQFCYGTRVVPSDQWFCDVCTEARAGESVGKPSHPRCQLCPVRGGAFKRTKCGQWVHVQCFLWIPELRVEQGDDDALALGALSSLDPDRKTLDCSLCHSRQGDGIIQCAHKRCLCAFHVSCAAAAHYRMEQLDGQHTGSGTLFLAYCPLHRRSTAPVVFPEPQKTPPSAKARPSKPAVPTRVLNPSSPSHLLASPSSAEARKKAKTFRRLKKKYDASQSHMLSEPGPPSSPASTSPWQKRMRRSKRRREACRVLAAAYIEDAADVRGEEDEEDEYGDDDQEAADDSFINDSSQLLYSQSVASPEETGNDKSEKKKRKKSSPNMRAIYARSLLESQSSPLLLRRGGRQLGALPSNGVIQACLDELHSRPNEARRMPMEAEPSPSFNLLGTGKPLSPETAPSSTVEEEDLAPPSFNLLGARRPGVQPATLAQDTGADEVHKKVEANRLKALKKLEERRKATRQQGQAQQPLLHQRAAPSGVNDLGFTSKETRGDEGAAPSSEPKPRAAMAPTVERTSPKTGKPTSIQQDEPPKWIIFASPSFASSSASLPFCRRSTPRALWSSRTRWRRMLC